MTDALLSLSFVLPTLCAASLSAQALQPPGCVSLAFDGVDDAVLVPPDPAFMSTSFTVSAWTRIPAPRSGSQVIVGIGEDPGTDISGWNLYVTDTGEYTVRYEASFTAQPTVLPSGQLIADDVWHHVVAAGTASGGIALYVDGALVADFPNAPSVLPTVNQFLSIGCSFGANSQPGPQSQPATAFLAGRVDEVLYWNRRLAPGEIADLAQGQLPANLAGLVARWRLDDGQGQTVVDDIGGRDGYLGLQPTPDAADPVWTSYPYAVPAVETVRPGIPANPSALLGGASGGPVIGAAWDPRVDHATFASNAIVDVLAIGPVSVNALLPGVGTLLVDPASSLLVGPVLPGAPWAIGIPSNCAFVGYVLFAQAAAFVPTGISVTNGLDLEIGTP